jgi:subtilase family protein
MENPGSPAASKKTTLEPLDTGVDSSEMARSWHLVGALLAVLAAGAVVARAGAAAPPPVPPDDPGWPGQWGLRLIQAPALWAFAIPDARPVIALVDTGANASFPDLRDAIVPGWNLADNLQSTDDTAGHGTDVALVTVANANNHYGIAGACPMCRVMPVKISDDGQASARMIAAGIRWAVDHGARIISVSLTATGSADPDEQAAVDYAGARGAVVLAAVGNDGTTAPHYPAALRGVVSVAGTDANDQLYPWSTYGSWVDLTAPGCEYGTDMCGTSYAPPLVAAAIGLLTAAAPGITPVAAVNALRATAVHVAGVGGGRIDIRAAADALGIPPVPPATGTAQPLQQVRLQSGSFRRALRKHLTVGTGPLTVILHRAGAGSCTMALRAANAVYLTWRSTPNELDIGAKVAAGRYLLAVDCADSRTRPYDLSISARFPVS